MTKKSSFGLTPDEKALLSASLELFLSNEIEDVSFKIKQEQNILTFSALSKLSTPSARFNKEDLMIMFTSLVHLQVLIIEDRFIYKKLAFYKDTEKCRSIILDISNMIESVLNEIGLSAYSL